MTNNTQFKTLLNTWLNQKKPMITPSAYASFTLIAENHLIPHFGKRKIGSITEQDIQSYISYLYESGRLDKSGGLTVKTIRDVMIFCKNQRAGTGFYRSCSCFFEVFLRSAVCFCFFCKCSRTDCTSVFSPNNSETSRLLSNRISGSNFSPYAALILEVSA